MEAEVVNKIEAFFRPYPLKKFNKGHILVFPDEDPGYIFHLITGKVKVYDISPNGEEIIVNSYKPPAFFPISWALNHEKNQYFYGMETAVTLRQAPPKDVIKFLKDNNDVTLDLLSRVYRGAEVILRRMAHIMGGNANTRVIFELITECIRTKKESDGTYKLDLSEGKLATRAALSRETVNRVIKTLKTDNLVKVSRNKINVLNFSVLEDKLGHLL